MSKMVLIHIAGMEEGMLIDPEGNSFDKITWNPLYVKADLFEVIEPDKKHEGTCMVVMHNQKTPVWVKRDAAELAAEVSG